MDTTNNSNYTFAVCVAGTEPDLEHRKVYRVIPDSVAASENYLRVIDESGEDYLYPASYFVPLDLSRSKEAALLQAF